MARGTATLEPSNKWVEADSAAHPKRSPPSFPYAVANSFRLNFLNGLNDLNGSTVYSVLARSSFLGSTAPLVFPCLTLIA